MSETNPSLDDGKDRRWQRRPAPPVLTPALVAARAAGDQRYGRRLHATDAAMRIARACGDADRAAELEAVFEALASEELQFHQSLYGKKKT